MEPNMSVAGDLDNYIEFLFSGLEGYIYVAAKDPNESDVIKAWKQEFFAYPSEVAQAKNIIRAASSKFEVYVAPALYSEKSAKRESVKVSNVVWTEFDGNAPTEWEEGLEPSLILRSSGESNQHVYWRLTDPICSADEIEAINRRITYNLQADTSAWDATQVLRPPDSYNHKRQASTALIYYSDVAYDREIFNRFSPVPDQMETNTWEVASLPDIQDVLLSYEFTPDLVQLLKKSKEEVGVGKRSSALMQLAYGCCQMGMTDVEVFVVLQMADNLWEKFKGRKDREKRLAHIITVARNKYPDVQPDEEEQFTLAFGYQSFLDTEIEIEWAVEPMLMESGSMLMVGPPGIGKTQIALQFMIHIALGKDYLHYKMGEPKKIVFLSLEMGHGELKVFLESMDVALTPAERALLEDNLIIIPHGESWPLNTVEGQAQLVSFLESVQPYGLFIDSIGSAIIGNISSDETIQPLINFNDKIRKRFGMFVWYIHHTRKHERGSNGNVTQDDIYGNMYLAARATSTYGILAGKGGTIKIRNFKNRLAAKEEDYLLHRKDNLQFEKTTQVVDDNLSHIKGTNDKSAGGFDL